MRLDQDYDIVLPLMAAAGVSSLLVEVFSRTENEVSAKETTAAMPRDMSLEIGLRVSGEADILMSKVKVRQCTAYNNIVRIDIEIYVHEEILSAMASVYRTICELRVLGICSRAHYFFSKNWFVCALVGFAVWFRVSIQ